MSRSESGVRARPVASRVWPETPEEWRFFKRLLGALVERQTKAGARYPAAKAHAMPIVIKQLAIWRSQRALDSHRDARRSA